MKCRKKDHVHVCVLATPLCVQQAVTVLAKEIHGCAQTVGLYTRQRPRRRPSGAIGLRVDAAGLIASV